MTALITSLNFKPSQEKCPVIEIFVLMTEESNWNEEAQVAEPRR